MKLLSKPVLITFLLAPLLFLTPHADASMMLTKTIRLQTRINRQNSRLQRKNAKIANLKNRPTVSYCVANNLTERQCIDAWIARHGFDQYGNPAGTMYAGGTPLFNEVTGKYMNRYRYIISQHPNRPWWNMK